MSSTLSRNESLIKDLFQKYGLYYDKENPDSKDNEVYRHKHYTIITRGGIQKIEEAASIACNIVVLASGADYCNVSCTATLPSGQSYTTLASANSLSSKSPYYVEMAEKRGRSRAILTLAGLYKLGAYGEDEADDFQSAVKDARGQSGPAKTQYKGV